MASPQFVPNLKLLIIWCGFTTTQEFVLLKNRKTLPTVTYNHRFCQN